MHKPWHSLLFGLLVFAALGLISFTFPKDGLLVAGTYKLNFMNLSELKSNTSKKDISKILAAIDALDTTNLVTNRSDATELAKDSGIKLITSIQYKNQTALKNFFVALGDVKSSAKSIRVLHYGDSQIEGDRISDYLRLKLQGQFGGQGPGLISLMPIAPSVTNKITNGPGWDRYNVFTYKDSRVNHSNYGVLAGFNRFGNYKKISDTTSVISSSLEITTTKFGGSNALAYKKVKLFYGGAQAKTWCEFYDGPALVAADSLEAGGNFRIREYEVGQGSNTHHFKFSGKDSPDFYALSLESDQGVMVDNIALRGSSGTFFHLINAEQLKTFYNYLNVKLIVLQFGGNVMPSIKDGTMAVNFGSYMKNQIQIVKKLAPNASILFIGPSDMSVKQGTEYVTTPYLEETRNAIKKAVLESDCAFFDMYDCMGGRNSMPSWVDQKLAATDYIHFSPQGARKMATLLYTALINEYNAYLRSKKQ
ncbi:MAG: hypothetical protein IT236_10810 [Bacteroidia bacterium]|nr:hypothetical protein [Bacteroidia bacterium]